MSEAVTALADWITRGIKGHAESDVEYGLQYEVINASVSRIAGQEFSEAIDRVRPETVMHREENSRTRTAVK